MNVSVKIPQVGESVTEATISAWLVKDGDIVRKNQELLSLETDKASVEVVAEADGRIQIRVPAGQVIAVGAEVAVIDTSVSVPADQAAHQKTTTGTAPTSAPAGGTAGASSNHSQGGSVGLGVPPAHAELRSHLSPAVNRLVHENQMDPSGIEGTGRGGRLTKGDVMAALSVRAQTGSAAPAVSDPVKVASTTSHQALVAPSTSVTPSIGTRASVSVSEEGQGRQTRVPMTTIRKRIAERLVQSQQTTATLTTFNEIDMSRVNEIRAKYKDKFKEKYGISLGFMGFFAKAAIEALKAWPQVNAFIDGQDIVYNHYVHLGIAVSTDKGLMVPVIRDADKMTIPQIEMAIRDFALKARENKITVSDLQGGTFTISNGGVFGSLMSTPILNPPQTGILGLHKVQDRPVVVDGQIVIRPMMYVALSYDHRMIDGKEAVSFLVKIKESMEDPERMLLEI
ncbi:MAG: 2-oxoglutarate dehydrogenase complex dihydrolipoyllysine-residue succinyltransferase [Bdellovibrionaceae bacterium]|nr:2-oxoglutarate dehydrogenase complex dihydrolipoyllysine-residue succinyltransferase [Pseudobdellovibrionaceae bacterium]